MALEFSERIEIQDELLGLISGTIPFQMNEDPLNNRNIHIKLNNINSFGNYYIKKNLYLKYIKKKKIMTYKLNIYVSFFIYIYIIY